MKLLIPILIFPFLCFSQSYKDDQAKFLLNRVRHFQTDIAPSTLDLDYDHCSELGINSIIVAQGKNETKTKTIVRKIKDGKLAEKITPSTVTHYTYTQNSLLESITVTGRITRSTHYQYDDNRLIKKDYFEKGKLKSRLIAQYSPHNKIEFSLLQTGRKLKRSYSMQYTYVDALLSTQEFLKNNQLIKKWDYSCEPKGQLIDQKKLILSCKYVEESNDGSYINYFRKIENGVPLLYAHSFTKDSVNYASKCTREDGSILWTSEGDLLKKKYVYYSKKGDIKTTSILTYNANHQILEQVSTFGKKQKKSSKLVSTYNNDGTLSTSHSYYKGKMTYYRSYSYAKE